MRKKVLVLLLIAMIAFVASGCSLLGGNTGNNGNGGGTSNTIDLHEVYKSVKTQIEGYGSITNDITLPTSQGTVTINWSSDHPEIIDSNGHVTPPEQDTEVKLNCTLKANGSEETYVITILVKGTGLSFTVIRDVATGDAGIVYKVKATVVAVANQGFLLKDDTGYMYAYDTSWAKDLVVGDIIELEGEKAIYKGAPQLTKLAYQKVGTATVNQPQPESANIGELAANGSIAVQYIRIEGILTISGTYLNVAVAGIDNAQGSLQTTKDLSQFNGKRIIVTGYYLYTNGSNPLYANIIVTNVELSSDQSGTQQNLTVSTIDAVKTSKVGDTYKVKATVVATGSTGFLLQDSTGFIFVYMGNEFVKNVEVGDELELQGSTSKYYNSIQFSNGTYEKVGTKTVSYPTARVLDVEATNVFAGLAEPATEFVTVEGTLRISGNYRNLEIEGANAKGSLVSDVDLSSFADKKVVVSGYYLYTTGSTTKYVTIITTSVTLAADQGPELTTSTIAQVQAGTEGATYKVEAVVVAISAGVVVVKDDTGYITLNLSNSSTAFDPSSLAVGDKLSIQGASRRHGGAVQFNYPQYEKIGTEQVSTPTPTILNATTFDALDAESVSIQYVKLEATLRISGNYYNLEVEGSNKQGSIAYPIDATSLASLNNKKVSVEGYFVYATTGGNVRYLYIVATNITELQDPVSGPTKATVPAANQGLYYTQGITAEVSESRIKLILSSTDELEYDLYVDPDGTIYFVTNQGRAVCTFGDGTITFEGVTYSKQQQGTTTAANIDASRQGTYYAQYFTVEVSASKLSIIPASTETGVQTTNYDLFVDPDGTIYFETNQGRVVCTFGDGTITFEGVTYSKQQQGTTTAANIDASRQGTYYAQYFTVEVSASKLRIIPASTEAGVQTKDYDLFVDAEGQIYLMVENQKYVCTFGDGTITFADITSTREKPEELVVAELDATLQGTYYNDEYIIVVSKSSVLVRPRNITQGQNYILYVNEAGYFVIEENEKVYCTFTTTGVSNKFGTFTKSGLPASVPAANRGAYYYYGDVIEIGESSFTVTEYGKEPVTFNLLVNENGQIYFERMGISLVCTWGEETFTFGNYDTYSRNKSAKIAEDKQGTYFGSEADNNTIMVQVYDSSVSVKVATDTPDYYGLFENPAGQIFFEMNGARYFCIFGEGVVTVDVFGKFTEGADPTDTATVNTVKQNVLALDESYTIVRDIELYVSSNGCTISWISSDENVLEIDDNNKLFVHVPDTEKIITLTATITKGKATDTAQINVVVKPYTTIAYMKAGNSIQDMYGYQAIKGIVVATYNDGFLVKDASGYIRAYDNTPEGSLYKSKNDLQVGEEIIIRGYVSEYYGFLEFITDFDYYKTGEVEVVGEPTYQEFSDYSFDEIETDNNIRPVEIKGVLVTNGNYVNIVSRDGVTQGSLLANGTDYFSLNYQFVVVRGYVVYVQGVYAGIIPLSVQKDTADHNTTVIKQTIGEVLAAAEGTTCKVSGLIVASCNTGFLMKDDNDYIYIYVGEPSGKYINNAGVGKEVTVVGPTSQYGDRLQFNSPTIIFGSQAPFTNPTPIVLDADSFETMANADTVEVTYATLEGIFTENNGKINLQIEGTEVVANIINVIYNDTYTLIYDYLDNRVAITGYFVYRVTAGGIRYASFICTDMIVTDVIEASYYTVTVECDLEQVIIESNPANLDERLEEGTRVEINVVPQEGYRVASVTVNGEPSTLIYGQTLLFYLTEDLTIVIEMADSQSFDHIAIESEPTGVIIVTGTAGNDTEDAIGTYEDGYISAHFENIEPTRIFVTELKEGEDDYGAEGENILRTTFQVLVTNTNPLIWENHGSQEEPNDIAYAVKVLENVDSYNYYYNFFFSGIVKDVVIDDEDNIEYFVLTDDNGNDVYLSGMYNATFSLKYDLDNLPFAKDNEIVFLANFMTYPTEYSEHGCLYNGRLYQVNGSEPNDKAELTVTPTNGITEGARIFVNYHSGEYWVTDEATVNDGVITAQLYAAPTNIRVIEYMLDEELEYPEEYEDYIRISEYLNLSSTTFKFHIKNETSAEAVDVVVNDDGTWTVGIQITFNEAFETSNVEVVDIKAFGYLDGIAYQQDPTIGYKEETVVAEGASNVEVVHNDNVHTVYVTVPADLVATYTSEYYWCIPSYKGSMYLDYYLVLTADDTDISASGNLYNSFYYFSKFVDVVETEGDGTIDAPLNANDVLAIASYLPENICTNEYYYIELDAASDATIDYCNFEFKAGGETLLVYGLRTDDDNYAYGAHAGQVVGTPVHNGDKVLLYGQIYHYVDPNTEETTYEIFNARLIQVNDVDAAYELISNLEVEHDGTDLDPLSATDVAILASELNSGDTSKEWYYVQAEVVDIYNETYCNTHITDGVNTVIVYGLYNSDGSARYGTKDGFAGIPEGLSAGATVLLYGQLQNYNGTPEVINARLISVTPLEKE